MLFRRRLNQFKVRKSRRSWRWQSTGQGPCSRSATAATTDQRLARHALLTPVNTHASRPPSRSARTPGRCASVNGKQVEKSFRDKVHETSGRTLYGSGKKLAQDFQLKLTVDKRSANVTFADHGRTGKAIFGSAVEAYLLHLAVKDGSRDRYIGTYRKHIKPVFGDRTLVQVANDRDGVLDLLTVSMKDLSLTMRQHARQIIVGTCDEAVKAGKLGKHNLADIKLADNGTKKARTDFVFPTYAQVKVVAEGAARENKRLSVDGAGICVWLMRGCGLRIEEALAVEKTDFIEDGTSCG
jgi:hypothetical protein